MFINALGIQGLALWRLWDYLSGHQ